MTKLFGSNPFRAATIVEGVVGMKIRHPEYGVGTITSSIRPAGNGPHRAPSHHMITWDSPTKHSPDKYFKDAYPNIMREDITLFGDNPFYAIKEGKVKNRQIEQHENLYGEHHNIIQNESNGKNISTEENITPNGDLHIHSAYTDKEGNKKHLHSFMENGKFFHHNSPLNEGFIGKAARALTGDKFYRKHLAGTLSPGLIPKKDEDKAKVGERLNSVLGKGRSNHYKLAPISQNVNKYARLDRRSDKAADYRIRGVEPESHTGDRVLGVDMDGIRNTTRKLKISNIKGDASDQKFYHSMDRLSDTTAKLRQTNAELALKNKINARASADAQKLADIKKKAKLDSARRYRANRKRREAAKGKK